MQSKKKKIPKKEDGFTLIEMAIVLFIVALLLGGLLPTISSQVEQRQTNETRKQLDEIKDAMIGYAVSNGHLPCPDTIAAVTGQAGMIPNDGKEDRCPDSAGGCSTAANGKCPVTEGNVPWATLGTAPTDSWGNQFRYRVTSAFSDATPLATFSLSSTANLAVYQTCMPSCTNILVSATPVVILSHGKNGLGAINTTGGINAAPTSVDELENTNTNPSFVSRTPSPAGSTSGEFDDIVIWIPTGILFNRMVAAGKLP